MGASHRSECLARVVHVDSDNPLHCGIEFDEPRKIWCAALPPDDWDEEVISETGPESPPTAEEASKEEQAA